MNKNTLRFLFLMAFGAVQTAMAQIPIDEEHFPDPVFRQYLTEETDFGQDGVLTNDELANVEILDMNNENGSRVDEKGDAAYIRDLKGIEFFTALVYLNCSYNQLQELDLSQNVKLRSLDCRHNNLTALDLSQQPGSLFELYCDNNQLTAIDVSRFTSISFFSCTHNQLQELKVISTRLENLSCEYNQLTSLDVSGATILESLSCFNNKLKGEAMDNLIAGLTMTNARGYGTLSVINLTDAGEENVITSEQVAQAKERNWNVWARNGGNSEPYEGSSGDGEWKVAIDEENFPCEVLRTKLNVSYIDVNEDGYLNEYECKNVTGLELKNIETSELKGIEYFTELTSLECSGELTTLDVSKNTKLKNLTCNDTKLASLDLSMNVELTDLTINQSSLTSLDLSENVALRKLTCENNLLTELILPQTETLYQLYCNNNHLTELDLTPVTGLKSFTCVNNKLTSIDLSQNRKLEGIYCNDNMLTELDFSNCPVVTVVDCSSNQIRDEKMDAMIESLPDMTGKEAYIIVVDLLDENEQNICTKEQVGVLTGKNWIVVAMVTDNEVDFYEGSEPTGIDSLTTDPSPKCEGSFMYEISGRRITESFNVKPSTLNLPSGIYILNGKKILVK